MARIWHTAIIYTYMYIYGMYIYIYLYVHIHAFGQSKLDKRIHSVLMPFPEAAILKNLSDTSQADHKKEKGLTYAAGNWPLEMCFACKGISKLGCPKLTWNLKSTYTHETPVRQETLQVRQKQIQTTKTSWLRRSTGHAAPLALQPSDKAKYICNRPDRRWAFRAGSKAYKDWTQIIPIL